VRFVYIYHALHIKQLPETQAPTMIMPKRIPRNKHKDIGIHFVNGICTELHG